MGRAQDLIAEKGVIETFKIVRAESRDYVHELRKKGLIGFSEFSTGLPKIFIARRTLPEAWEDGIVALMGIGSDNATHYDPTSKEGSFISFPSMEATVMTEIQEPFGEPRLHKSFLGGWTGLGDYKAEIEGVKDSWMIQPADVAKALREGRFDEIKGDERWNYMYSQRMRAYPFFDAFGNLQTVNQLDDVVENLVKDPTSRSAQCVTWDARWDQNNGHMKDKDGKSAIWDHYHSPCLQRFWFRLKKTQEGYVLSVNGHWRSRDHLKAVPSNIYGVTEGMHEEVRLKLQDRLGVKVARGPYTDINDSLHLYGHYFDPRKQGLDAEAALQLALDISSGRPISERVIDPVADPDMYEIAKNHMQKEYEFRRAHPEKSAHIPSSFD